MASTTAISTSTASRPGSTTETYAALRLEIDNWRWAGVPFYIRTGKRLPITQTELRLVFKRPPRLGFVSTGGGRISAPTVSWWSSWIRRPASGSRWTPTAPTRAGAHAITLDMEFAEEGGEGPTPYEVLLHAAMDGDGTPFTRQDGVEEAWRVMAPLIEAPPPVHPYAQGSWGPKEADQLLAGTGRWHEPVGGVMTADSKRRTRAGESPNGAKGKAAAERPEQSAAAPSPFPPIADYAFLSDCHTGALLAPDGSIDWLCVPRFDAPSLFGSLLDREAGLFRLGPFGVTVPSDRHYVPGTNVLMTTWKTLERMAGGL